MVWRRVQQKAWRWRQTRVVFSLLEHAETLHVELQHLLRDVPHLLQYGGSCLTSCKMEGGNSAWCFINLSTIWS